MAGCEPAPQDRAARCEATTHELEACVGTAAHDLDCNAVSEADVNRIRDAMDAVSCDALARGLTIDGDPKSAICRLYGAGCVRSVTDAPERRPTRYPILLVSGIDASPLFRYSDRILRTMTDAGGQRVSVATLPPYQPTRVRAPELWHRIEKVRAATGAAKVNLVCHSLGGLDCRYLVSEGGLHWDLDVSAEKLASAVASITTIGTAHRGTRAADVLLGLSPDDERARLVDAFASLTEDVFGAASLEQDTDVRASLTALSTSDAARFEQEIVDAPGVYYQSWAGYSRPFGTATAEHDARVSDVCAPSDGSPVERIDHDYMALPIAPFADVVGKTASGATAPNDGFVTVDSAKWGEFRGCIPADHVEQLGQRNLPDANVRTGFDVARFYANVAADLAARGF
jgi:triacylglycerol lipase